MRFFRFFVAEYSLQHKFCYDSKFPYKITKLHSILFVANKYEKQFQSRTKHFSGWLLKILATLEFQPEASQKNALFSTEKYSHTFRY